MHRWAKEENEIAVHEVTINFKVNGKGKKFTLYHNFHVLELDIYKAFDEWAKQTRKPTALDFCGYVMGEDFDPKIVCVPKKEWKEFLVDQKLKG